MRLFDDPMGAITATVERVVSNLMGTPQGGTIDSRLGTTNGGLGGGVTDAVKGVCSCCSWSGDNCGCCAKSQWYLVIGFAALAMIACVCNPKVG